jgi:flagellar biosynthesis anti-sigma factor FlgM
MRVDPQNPAVESAGASSIDNTQSAQAKSAQKIALPEPNDAVQMRSGRTIVRQLVSQLDQIPDVRQEQVSVLRSALDSGRYSPSNAQVAEALAAQTLGVTE